MAKMRGGGIASVWSAIRPLLLLIGDVGSPYEIAAALLEAADCRPIIYIVGSELTRRPCA